MAQSPKAPGTQAADSAVVFLTTSMSTKEAVSRLVELADGPSAQVGLRGSAERVASVLASLRGKASVYASVSLSGRKPVGKTPAADSAVAGISGATRKT